MPQLIPCARTINGQPCDGVIDDGFCDTCGQEPQLDLTVAARTEGTTRRTSPSRGLVPLAPVEREDPATRLVADPSVPVWKRVCECGRPIGRRQADGGAAELVGVCECGRPFSFVPPLNAGETIGGQYLIRGCLDSGGLGWIYLAQDRNLDDRWVVVKGLLTSDDPDAAAAAIAERQVLIALTHPNIVQILNFVQHRDAGYIVMEYLPGSNLRQLRDRVDGRRVIPVELAIQYVLEVFPAIAYLHDQGLTYCDFKPENIISSEFTVKLVDMGAVFGLGITPLHFGTRGYQAPELVEGGETPSVRSDLYTVGRTLAILCTDFEGRTDPEKFLYGLPTADKVPLFAEHDSLYRFLRKATAIDPDDRFESADEMSEQLAHVQHEILARQGRTDLPPLKSSLFGEQRRGSVDNVDIRALPPLKLDPAETAGDINFASLQAVETLVESDHLDEAEQLAEAAGIGRSRDWRATWAKACIALRRRDFATARAGFDTVLDAVPGEVAPKLALGQVAELLDDCAGAAAFYETVSLTAPAMTTATFGLARCAVAMGDRARALTALARVPATSHTWTSAQLHRVRLLVGVPGDQLPGDQLPTVDELLSASAICDSLELEAAQRAEVNGSILEAAFQAIHSGSAAPNASISIAGRPLTEFDLRRGLEETFRVRARSARTARERITLVDNANRIRPWSRV